MPTIESTADPVSKQSFSPTEAIATPRSLEQSQEVENWSVCSGSPLAQRSTVLSDFSYKKIAPQVAIPESVYEDLQAEVSALRKESAKSKKEAQALERQYKELKALVAKTKGIGEKIEKELKANKDRVADLKAQQQNYAFLEPFFKLDTGKLAALDLPKIHKNQANIRSQLLGIFTMNGFQHFLGNGQHAHLSIESEDLQSLLRGLSHPDWSFNPYDTSNTIPVVHLVQSLIAVALRDWVFNAKFTCTTAMETPLVDAYRYHLSTICTFPILVLQQC
jgi:hypothetical protein